MIAGIFLQQVNHYIVVAFIQYLLSKHFTHSNIANYLAGVRACFVVYECDWVAFWPEQLQYFLKSIKLHRVFKPRANPVIILDQLLQIVYTCDSLPNLKALYPAVFSFLRVSNLFPHSIAIFDPTRQLAQAEYYYNFSTSA